jgi:hypothetical protein
MALILAAHKPNLIIGAAPELEPHLLSFEKIEAAACIRANTVNKYHINHKQYKYFFPH